MNRFEKRDILEQVLMNFEPVMRGFLVSVEKDKAIRVEAHYKNSVQY